jgi:hypothetical protein
VCQLRRRTPRYRFFSNQLKFHVRPPLAVTGHYPIQPSRVGFELEYAFERGGWKLMGIAVSVEKGGTDVAPRSALTMVTDVAPRPSSLEAIRPNGCLCRCRFDGGRFQS